MEALLRVLKDKRQEKSVRKKVMMALAAGGREGAGYFLRELKKKTPDPGILQIAIRLGPLLEPGAADVIRYLKRAIAEQVRIAKKNKKKKTNAKPIYDKYQIGIALGLIRELGPAAHESIPDLLKATDQNGRSLYSHGAIYAALKAISPHRLLGRFKKIARNTGHQDCRHAVDLVQALERELKFKEAIRSKEEDQIIKLMPWGSPTRSRRALVLPLLDPPTFKVRVAVYYSYTRSFPHGAYSAERLLAIAKRDPSLGLSSIALEQLANMAYALTLSGTRSLIAMYHSEQYADVEERLLKCIR